MTWFVDVVRVLAACTSTVMILSPLPGVYDVYKARTTGHASITPLVSMFANCHLWMMYGYLDGNIFPIFATFAFGDLISLAYIAVFYRFTDDRALAHRLFLGFGLALAAATAYAALGVLEFTHQSRADVTTIVGYIGIAASVVLYSSPFEHIGLVLRHRSAVFLPIAMVAAATLNNAMWVLYSSLTSDWFVFAPNTFTLVLCVVQLALYGAFYPATHPLAPLDDLAAKELEAGDGTQLPYVMLETPRVKTTVDVE